MTRVLCAEYPCTERVAAEKQDIAPLPVYCREHLRCQVVHLSGVQPRATHVVDGEAVCVSCMRSLVQLGNEVEEALA